VTAGQGVRGQNLYALDTNIQRLLERTLGGDLDPWIATLESFGNWVGGAVDVQAEHTHRSAPPVLEPYDRNGQLTNHIRHNPLWDQVATEVYQRGAVGLSYGDSAAPHTITFAIGYLLSQADVSLHCPVTMTGAVAYVLDRFAPAEIRDRYLPELVRTDGKALTGGTWATELHGGSDVGATTTVARSEGDHVRLTGLKWFVSNTNGGLALATARPQGAPNGSKGLGLYLVPTHVDGAPNDFRIRRLKDKLGTIGVPTGEVDLLDAWALEVAPPPLGFKLMMEALGFSRIHNAVAAAGLGRRAFLEAVSYLRDRDAFGQNVLRYPMMQDEILDMLVRLESGTAMAFAAAHAFDVAHVTDIDDETSARAWLRLVTALAKYQTADDANVLARAAIELIGGNAYTYDYVTPRLLRDAQVLTVWEGPANIQALEVLRMIGNRAPGFEAMVDRVAAAARSAPTTLGDIAQRLERAMQDCRDAVAYVRSDPAEAQRHARRLMILLSDTLGGALLLEEAIHDLGHGDARKALIARLYMDKRFPETTARGIGPGRDWVHRHFDALIAYEQIDADRHLLRAVG
jgi:acyl-CoA dehydrogenase